MFVVACTTAAQTSTSSWLAGRTVTKTATRWLLCGLASMILPMLITRWTREMGMVAMPFVSLGTVKQCTTMDFTHFSALCQALIVTLACPELLAPDLLRPAAAPASDCVRRTARRACRLPLPPIDILLTMRTIQAGTAASFITHAWSMSQFRFSESGQLPTVIVFNIALAIALPSLGVAVIDVVKTCQLRARVVVVEQEATDGTCCNGTPESALFAAQLVVVMTGVLSPLAAQSAAALLHSTADCPESLFAPVPGDEGMAWPDGCDSPECWISISKSQQLNTVLLWMACLIYCFTAIALAVFAQATTAFKRAKDSAKAAAQMQCALRYVSHETRSPLNGAALSLSLLDDIIRGFGNRSDSPQLVGDLHASVEAAKRQLDDMLTFERVTSLRAAKGVFGEPVSAYEVFADIDRIMSVIGNAMSNAIKIAPADGEGRVTVSLLVAQANLLKGKPAVLVIEVLDNGKGIAPVRLETDGLFQPFQQLRMGDGMLSTASGGLGLSTVRAIVVDQMGGDWLARPVTILVVVTQAWSSSWLIGRRAGSCLAPPAPSFLRLCCTLVSRRDLVISPVFIFSIPRQCNVMGAERMSPCL
ncbi:hypothetical protein FNF28_07506 [Cafeteria roenbergensis]|uniref:histidine kinase n=1 Tax=Cafeteria roenbergensis TaxID=33653 RepID=A0A5A8C513_CAFRO|nr:hypothetical protein FNF28_07506 [Cafeteria roenbergensis]